MLLRVPAGQMPHEARAERLGPVLLLVRLRDGAKVPNPLVGLVELVGIVDDMAELVPQIAEDVGAARTFDVSAALRVIVGQLLPRQIERDRNGDRPERHAPLR